MENFYIGIDSGGSRSRVLIADPDGNPIAKEEYHSIHYSMFGKEAVAQFLSNKISDSLKKNKLNLKGCKGICAGIAGARDKKVRKSIAKSIKRLLKFRKVIVETDSHIAYYGAFHGEEGIILINGTGSIIYGEIERKTYRIGGWGKILGDSGSGYSIGLDALRKITNEFDLNTRKKSKLTRELNNKFGINRDTILKKIYQENFEIQNLTPLVIKLAEEGDGMCRKIIKKSTQELTELILTFLKVYGKRNRVNLALIGSTLENKNLLSKQFRKYIRERFRRRILLIKKKSFPEFGAFLIAKDYF